MDAGTDHSDHDAVRTEVGGWPKEDWGPDLTVRHRWVRLAKEPRLDVDVPFRRLRVRTRREEG